MNLYKVAIKPNTDEIVNYKKHRGELPRKDMTILDDLGFIYMGDTDSKDNYLFIFDLDFSSADMNPDANWLLNKLKRKIKVEDYIEKL